ncbi:MAG: PEGA domain-containing protein [Acidobacteriota bacterium]|nr:PEGA domain-containing protein [Acidobacteriota bacterium]
MSQRPDDDSADPDPLLLFANEPQSVTAPASQAEIPNEIEPAQTTRELDALVHRADTAERLLRESRRDAAALRREVATLVSAAKDNRAQARRSAVTLGLAAACLVALVTVGWRFIPSVAPPVAAAVDPATVAVVDPPPAIQEPEPTPAASAAVSPPRRDGQARAQQRTEPEPRAQFVGTLSVDAVPTGGEVFINRQSVGKAPVRLSGLRAGSHLVWIERAGYRRFTRVVTVPADQVTRVCVALEPDDSPSPSPRR